jgi:adenylylsulfate kinase
MSEKNKNIIWHEPSVTLDDRWKRNRYKSCLIWFTGLSASGKSSIAHVLDKRLHRSGIHSYVLDGDNVRHGLNKDLGLSPKDRKENIRRIGEVSRLFVDAGLIVLAAFIAPYREDRRQVRDLLSGNKFVEIYVKCPLHVCEERDPKGFYHKARTGEIDQFTGISAPYEEPQKADIVIESDKLDIEACVKHILNYLIENEYIKAIEE